MGDWSVLVGIIGGSMGIGGAVWAIITAYSTARVKAYAAEQEFKQLQVSLSRVSAEIVALNKDQNYHFEEFKEILRDIRYALTGVKRIQTGEYLIKKRGDGSENQR